MQVYFAKGGGGGGHSSGGHSSSAGRSSSSRSSSSSSKSSSKATPSKPVAGKSTAKPGSTVKTADGKTVKSSTAKPANSKYTKSKGVVGDNGYTPRFSGYSAPAGSVVYYPQHSGLDYLPWIYLFSQNNSPHNDQATVVQPDGKQVVAEPVKGADGMYIFNWIFLIVICIAVLVGIVWGINKLTKEKQSEAH